jgi:hypothetical protein
MTAPLSTKVKVPFDDAEGDDEGDASFLLHCL